MNYSDIQNTLQLHNNAVTRRQFFRKNAMGLGSVALSSLLPKQLMGAETAGVDSLNLPHFAPRAKRVLYVSLIGAPSQFETFDYKPKLKEQFGKDIKDFLAESGQRLTGMTANLTKFPVAPSFTDFSQCGKSGTWISDMLPYHQKIADDITIIRSMCTDAINHEPANQLIYTGSMQPDKASIGSWLSYGLGSMNDNLPTFVTLLAQHSGGQNVQALSPRVWSSGYLPGKHSGVHFRPGTDPVLYLKDLPGIDRDTRRNMLDGLNELNQFTYDQVGDSEIQTRMAQYEMAYRMQMSVPELTDFSNEPEYIYDMYGEAARTQPDSFAAQALMSRRLLERGVRFVQLFQRGWDHHGGIPNLMPQVAGDLDQPMHALIQDLKQRGMFDDTLIIFGGEFGRTVYSQGALTESTYGRDHHPRAFSIWMAGAGVKQGHVHGETDEYSFNVTREEDKVHVRDLHATILERCGMDHRKFKYKHNGLEEKLTGVVPAKVVKPILQDPNPAIT